MNTKSISLLIIILAAVFSFAVWMGTQTGAQDADAQHYYPTCTEGPRTITVTGDADVRVVPDEVVFTFGVETWDKDLETAKQDNDERISRILDLAQNLKIESKHIQTEHISIEPHYEDWYEKYNLTGFYVRKTIVITLTDLSVFEDLLTGALDNSATHVHGIQFRTSELRKHKDEARSLAINAAKEKAVALTEELGQDIGDPISISENHNGWWSWYGSWWGSYWGGRVAQNVIQNAPGNSYSNDGTMAPGQITVNAGVTVTFEIR